MSKHRLRNNRKLNLLTGRLKPCLKISLFIVIHFEMTWNRRNTAQQRVRKKADYGDRHNIYMFNKFCTLGTDFTLSDFRLRFRLRKTRFTDLLKILDKVLSTLYKERTATYNVATRFIALRFYTTFVRGELWSRSLAIYLVSLYFLHALNHS